MGTNEDAELQRALAESMMQSGNPNANAIQNQQQPNQQPNFDFMTEDEQMA